MTRARVLFLATVGMATALVVSDVPAFTATPTGTQALSLTVTVQLPPAPCIEFLTPPGTSVSFGTASFTRPQIAPTGDIAPKFRNCGTADEQITIEGTQATSPSTTWTLVAPGEPMFCPTTPPNKYSLAYGKDGGSFTGSVYSTPTEVYPTVAPGAEHTLAFLLLMPCEGSDGAGETFSFGVTLTAAVA
jgi:hypothetical protein